MREHESDSGDGGQQPPGYVSPWAPRGETEVPQGSGSEANATPPPGSGPADTIAFGMPPGPADGYGQASTPGDGSQPAWWNRLSSAGQPKHGNEPGYADQAGPGGQPSWWNQPGPANQAGYGNQAGPANQAGPGNQGSYGNQPGYGSQAAYGDRPGYGNQPGYGSQAGYGDQPGYGNQPGYGQGGDSGGAGGFGGHGGDGGYGSSGWTMPGFPPPERPKRRGHFLVYVVVAALAASIGAGLTVALDNQNSSAASGISSSDVPAPRNNAPGSGSSASPLNVKAVQKKVDPGLVDISSTLKYQSETADGTGMVLSSNGLVLTNNHVIDGATSISAWLVLDQGKKYQARVLGYDDTDDVALLQLVGASGLTTVKFGNSAQVSLGTPVLALGNAEGRGGVTPAQGIIDALNRSIQASDQGSGTTENLNHMLQTDAPIRQGDSGGALANKAGQVIGMITAANTSTPSQSGSTGGTLGYAIPINSALSIARQINLGNASSTVYIGLPGFLGVQVAVSSSANPRQQASDEEQSGGGGVTPGGNRAACQNSNSQLSVPARIAPADSGALILGVLCGAPAQAGGLAAGDVILAVDGQAVTTPGSLTGITARYHPGAVVSVRWQAIGGARHTTPMKLTAGPAR
jgi:S1-C subfamily serine protease